MTQTTITMREVLKGERHAIKVTRSPLTWGAGRSLTLVDDKAGFLECVRTRQRLKIEDWGG